MTKEARIYNGEKTASSIMVLEKLDSDTQKNQTGYPLTPCTKINSKWVKYLNIGPETIKLLEENIDSKLFDIYLSNILLGMSPQARETKTK